MNDKEAAVEIAGAHPDVASLTRAYKAQYGTRSGTARAEGNGTGKREENGTGKKEENGTGKR
jgi:hypothetical protein